MELVQIKSIDPLKLFHCMQKKTRLRGDTFFKIFTFKIKKTIIDKNIIKTFLEMEKNNEIQIIDIRKI